MSSTSNIFSKLVKLIIPCRLPKWSRKLERKVCGLGGEGRKSLITLTEKNEDKVYYLLPPKGCVFVYVGRELLRYVIPVSYFGTSEFAPVMEMVEKEYGFDQTGGLRIPCDVDEFEEIIHGIKD